MSDFKPSTVVGPSENLEPERNVPSGDISAKDESLKIADRLEHESGRDGMEDLAHLNDSSKRKDIEYAEKSELVDFKTMNIMAHILDEGPLSKADFNYDSDNSERRGEEILSAMDTPIVAIRSKRFYESDDGTKRQGVDDPALDSLLNSDVSPRAKIYTLMYILAGGEKAFDGVSMNDLEDSKWKSIINSLKDDALKILSMYSRNTMNTQDMNSQYTENLDVDKFDDSIEKGEDEETKLEMMLEVDLSDYEGLDTNTMKLEGDELFPDGLKKDVLELFSRFKKESKLSVFQVVMTRLTDENILKFLRNYRKILTEYKNNILDEKMDVSDEIELHENFNFVYSTVRKILNKYES